MKILLLTENVNYLEQNNPDFSFLYDLNKYVDQIHVVVINQRKGLSAKKMISLDGRIFVYPTNHISGFTKRRAVFELISRHVVWTKQLIVDLIIAENIFDAGYYAYDISQNFKVPFVINIMKDFVLDHQMKKDYKIIFGGAGGLQLSNARLKDKILKINSDFENKIFTVDDYVDYKSIDDKQIQADLTKNYPSAGFTILVDADTEELNFYKEIFQGVKTLNENNIRCACILIGANRKKKRIVSLASQIIPTRSSIEDDDSNLYDYLKKANLFVQHADSGQFNRQILVSILSGCPILTADRGMARSYIDDGYTGYFFDINNKNIAETLVQSVMDVIRDPNIRDKIMTLYRKRLIERVTTNKDEYYTKYINELSKHTQFVDLDHTFYKF